MSEDKKPKKKKKAGDVFLTIVLIAAICVFCYAAYNLYHIYTEYKKGSDEYNAIAQMAVTERDPDQDSTSESEEAAGPDGPALKAPLDIDFDSLRSINTDVIGWIYVEALDGVSYPVVKGTDNDQYLHLTYEKNYNFAGTIFIDYENKADFSDCNTLVYGHNMKNGTMFGQIISAYTTAVNSDTYTLFKGPGQEFVDYMNKIVSYSDVKTTPGELGVDDKIVTLSTCTGNESTRYVVQGKRVDTLDVVKKSDSTKQTGDN